MESEWWWIVPIDVEALNPGIRKTVSWLRSMGFETIDSGDGETHEFECDRPYGYVTIRLQEWQDLARCVEAVCVALEARGAKLDSMDGAIVDGLYKRGVPEGLRRSTNGVFFIDINDINDSKLDWSVQVNPGVIRRICEGHSQTVAMALCDPAGPNLRDMMLRGGSSTYRVDCHSDAVLDGYRGSLETQARWQGLRAEWSRRRGRLKLFERTYGSCGKWRRAGIIEFRGPKQLGKASKA